MNKKEIEKLDEEIKEDFAAANPKFLRFTSMNYFLSKLHSRDRQVLEAVKEVGK